MHANAMKLSNHERFYGRQYSKSFPWSGRFRDLWSIGFEFLEGINMIIFRHQH